MIVFLKKCWLVVVLGILMLWGGYLRLYNLSANCSFWSDEAHVAVFSRAILQTGKPVLESGYTTKIFQWALYWTTVASMRIFGISEFGARLPVLIFGTLTILATYLLGKKLFNEKTALLSAFFITFLNIEILWSRQLRPYQFFQFFWLLGSFFSFKFLKDRIRKDIMMAILCGLLSVLFHPMGVMFFLVQLIFYLYLWLRESKNKQIVWGIGLFSLIGAFFFLIIPSFLNLIRRFGQFNNFFYYRVFLTHNYLPLVLFCLLGFYFLLIKNKKREFVYFALVLGMQTFAVSFLAPQPFTRYFYPVFVFIILLSSYGLTETGYWILDIGGQKTGKDIRYQKLDISGFPSIKYLVSNIMVLVVIFSLWKSDKLSLFPKKIYSLNADMQEIPEVDWKKIYQFVGEKLGTNPKAVFLDNWNDLPVWFLGEGKLDYLVRKNNRNVIDFFSGASVVGSLESLKKVISENKNGIFVLDSWDDFIPDGVKEYCHTNLKREFEIDRAYPVQPRYWTVWVYSWGYDDIRN